jgi:hypothetical protein
VSAAGVAGTTDGGSYVLAGVPAGTVTVTVSGPASGSKSVTVPSGQRVQANFSLDCSKNPQACGFKP